MVHTTQTNIVSPFVFFNLHISVQIGAIGVVWCSISSFSSHHWPYIIAYSPTDPRPPFNFFFFFFFFHFWCSVFLSITYCRLWSPSIQEGPQAVGATNRTHFEHCQVNTYQWRSCLFWADWVFSQLTIRLTRSVANSTLALLAFWDGRVSWHTKFDLYVSHSI